MKIFGISKKELKRRLLEVQEEKKNLMFINEEHKKVNGKIMEELKGQQKLVTKKANKINEQARELESAKEVISRLSEEILQYKNTIRKINGSKGGLTTENNKLKKLVGELTKKLEESMTDKYILKKVPAGKRPKGEPIRIKSHAVQSKIVKQMHREDSDE